LGRKKKEEEGAEKKESSEKKKKKNQKSKPAKMHILAEMTRNTLKFYPRWNGGLSRTGLHTGIRFSVRSSRNRTEFTTLLAGEVLPFL
jgi:hypothetical protein